MLSLPLHITTSYSATFITFESSSSNYLPRLFKLPLIPGDMFTYYSDITVKITVGLQKAICSYDSDPKFFLSDGSYGIAIGFEMREEATRCQGIQGTMGDALPSRSIRPGGASHQSSVLPEEFVFTIKPNEDWGSCYFAADSGLISPTTYTGRINPQRGLCLEVYAEDSTKKYLFNYIIVEIHEN